jgi:hypothetical protein
MKSIKLTVVLIFCGWMSIASAQRYQDKKYKSEETITKELTFNRNSPDNILVVENVYGSIDVEGYSGTTIQVEVTKKIYADSQEDLQKGKEEIGVKSAKKDDAVYVYMDSPYSKFDLETGQFEHHEFNYNYRKNYKHRKKRMYTYRLDFKVKVPKNSSIDIKAVNHGNITVKDVQGKLLIVHNINGAIDLINVAGQTDVNALNKDINITYAENPTEESWYRSLNGDIKILFKEDLNASISYKTMNGGFYTNFDVENTKPMYKTTQESRSKGTKYKVNSKRHFKIGNGKVDLHFDQLNGDTIVKK